MEEPIRQDALDEWRTFQEHRASGIGATDTPKILGLSRWGTALSVYTDKVEPSRDPDPPSLPAWLGLKLQSTVAELYTAATEQRVRAANGHYVHKSLPWLVCHLDFRGWGKPQLIIECKTRAHMKGWGDDGSGVVPSDVWAQCQHEMLVTDSEETHVAALFGHHSFKVYRILRDESWLEMLVPKLDRFWFENVVAKVPPEPTGHPVDTQIVRDRNPTHRPHMRSATPTQEMLVRNLRAATQRREEAAFQEEEIKNKIIDVIGTWAGLTGSFGSISFKRTKDVETIQWREVATAYRAMIETLMPWATVPEGGEPLMEHIRQFLPLVTETYTTKKEGVRRFLPSYTEATP